jgi:hypothetical protein
MPHVIEHATSGRAKCRGCGGRIDKGELRFGENRPNAYGDGEMTLWFHVPCAAYKRPEPFLEVLRGETPEHISSDEFGVAEALESVAEFGIVHRRVPRIDKVERARSARARCRNCREMIGKGNWRIGLVFFEGYRFEPSGYVHAGCAEQYFGTTDLDERIAWFNPGLAGEDLDDFRASLKA